MSNSLHQFWRTFTGTTTRTVCAGVFRKQQSTKLRGGTLNRNATGSKGRGEGKGDLLAFQDYTIQNIRCKHFGGNRLVKII
jgi:hypothetical protein